MRNRFPFKSNEIGTNSNLTMLLPLPPMPPLCGMPKAVRPPRDGKNRRDTPGGVYVSAPSTEGAASNNACHCEEAQRPTWQSVLLPSPLGTVHASHGRGCGLPRRFAPRNDVEIFGWSFYIKIPGPCGPVKRSFVKVGRSQGSPLRDKSARPGHPGRGVPTEFSFGFFRHTQKTTPFPGWFLIGSH